jgi:hypothetical protein
MCLRLGRPKNNQVMRHMGICRGVEKSSHLAHNLENAGGIQPMQPIWMVGRYKLAALVSKTSLDLKPKARALLAPSANSLPGSVKVAQRAVNSFSLGESKSSSYFVPVAQL